MRRLRQTSWPAPASLRHRPSTPRQPYPPLRIGPLTRYGRSCRETHHDSRSHSTISAMAVMDDPDWADMLPSRAEAIRERAEEEAREGIRWTTWFSPRFQRRLLRAFDASYSSFAPEWESAISDALAAYVNEHSDYATPYRTLEQTFSGGMLAALPPEQLDWLAAMPIVLEQFSARYSGQMSDDTDFAVPLEFDVDGFVERVDDLLLDERVAYVFIRRRIRPRTDAPLHLDLVAPTEALLSSDQRFRKAEAAYVSATSNLATGHYGSAITGAASALQESLSAIGASDTTLKRQVEKARQLGVFQGHDARLIEVLTLISGWFNADRSARGDAHGAPAAKKEDAELALHIAAAIMLRLMRRDEDEDEDDQGPAT